MIPGAVVARRLALRFAPLLLLAIPADAVPLRVTVYNSAGETIKGYPAEEVALQVTTFSFTYTNAGSCTPWSSDPGAPFSPDADCANDIVMFDFSELTSTVTGRFDKWRWDGRAVAGGWAPNGSYLVVASTSNTTTGTPADVTRALVLSAVRPQITAKIYNAAGLVVATLPVLSLPGAASVRADSPLFVPDVPGQAVITFTLRDAAGASLGVLTWNGRDDAGRLVPAGAYLLGVSIIGGGSGPQYLTETFSVSHGPLDLVRDVALVPNPVASTATRAWIRYALTGPGSVLTVRVRVYDIAGLAVADFDATGQTWPDDPRDANGSGTATVSWDLRVGQGRRVPPGLYLVVLELTGPAGLTQRVTKRLAVR